jgi:hypothetical protein
MGYGSPKAALLASFSECGSGAPPTSVFLRPRAGYRLGDKVGRERIVHALLELWNLTWQREGRRLKRKHGALIEYVAIIEEPGKSWHSDNLTNSFKSTA